ncbi:MAG: hypothetical protein J0L97_04700 [Alphaproteobacteria bacterium]|nr:hypothetical protein [Alphaproteobacteria bacterium]
MRVSALVLVMTCMLAAQASAQQPVTPPTAPAAASPDASAPATEASKEEERTGISENGWRGSLMFPVSELRRFTDALETYARRLKAKAKGEGENYDNLPPPEQVLNPEEGPPKVEAKAFFLGSVAYINDKEWTVWINGQVYTIATPPADFEIVNVKEHEVTLRWKVTPEDLATVFPHWQEKVRAIDDETRIATLPVKSTQQKDKGLMASGAPIYYVRAGQFLQFTLHSNQTFISRGMEIVEGKVAASVVTPSDPSALDGASETPGTSGEPGAAPPSEGQVAPPGSVPPAGSPVALERGASDKLIDMYKKVTPSSPTKKP